MFKLISSDHEFEEFMDITENSVVYFSAKWCGPCKSSGPIFEELASNGVFDQVFAKVDVEDCPLASSSFLVRSVPSLVMLKGRHIIATRNGGFTRGSLIQFLENV
jgi:thioredoxin 1